MKLRGTSTKGPNRNLATRSSAIHNQLNPPNRRMRTRMYGGVGGEDGQPSPYPDCANRSFDATRISTVAVLESTSCS